MRVRHAFASCVPLPGKFSSITASTENGLKIVNASNPIASILPFAVCVIRCFLFGCSLAGRVRSRAISAFVASCSQYLCHALQRREIIRGQDRTAPDDRPAAYLAASETGDR